jgi:hypothetical protein
MNEIETDVCCPDCSSHEIVFIHAVVAGAGSLEYIDLNVEPGWEPDIYSDAWCPHCQCRGKLHNFLTNPPTGLSSKYLE